MVPDADDDHHDHHYEASVRAHLRRLSAAADAHVAALSTAEFDAALTSRLVAAEQLQSTDLGFSYAFPFTAHIHEVLTLDLPTTVVTLADSRIAATRRPVPSLLGTGRANLLALLGSTEFDVQPVSQDGSSVYAVTGESPYTASFVRLLDDAASRWLPELDVSNGFVFAVPHRHAVILQPCSSAVQVHDALELVPAHAQRLYDEGASPVSVHTYHWLAGRVTCLTRQAEDGTLRVQPAEPLEQVLGLRRWAG
ncbi:MAG: hypothetical protein ACJ714_15625 [Ornithinibacter sp.]